jgi:hypothetical protein
MTNARSTRHSAISHWLAVPVVLLAGAGCQRVPVRYHETAPAAATTTPVASDPVTSVTSKSSETPDPEPPALAVPALTEQDPAPPSRADNRPLTRLSSSHSPTPLLDAAIARADVRTPAATAEPDEGILDLQPEPAPTPPPAKAKVPTPAPASPAPKVDPQLETAGIPPRPRSDHDPDPSAADDTPPLARKPAASNGKPNDPEKTPPADSWIEGLDRLRKLAKTEAEKRHNGQAEWSLRVRALDALRSELSGAEEVELWDRFLDVLTSISSTETPDEGSVGARVHKAVDALEALAPLRIDDLQVCHKVFGFGHFETIDPATLKAGQALIVYCEMSGLKYGADQGGFRSRLASRVELVARKGGRPVWSQDLGTAEDLCRHRRRDYYVNYRLTLPTSLSPGAYELRLTQTDLNSDRSVSSSLALEIRP